MNFRSIIGRTDQSENGKHGVNFELHDHVTSLIPCKDSSKTRSNELKSS